MVIWIYAEETENVWWMLVRAPAHRGQHSWETTGELLQETAWAKDLSQGKKWKYKGKLREKVSLLLLFSLWGVFICCCGSLPELSDYQHCESVVKHTGWLRTGQALYLSSQFLSSSVQPSGNMAAALCLPALSSSPAQAAAQDQMCQQAASLRLQILFN